MSLPVILTRTGLVSSLARTLARAALSVAALAALPVAASAAPAQAPAAAAAATAAAAAQPSNASDVVDRVQQFYSGIKQVTALFRQTVTNETFGSTKTSDGTVWIMKPGKMRWDYVEKKKDAIEVKKSFLSNGTTLYVIEHDNKQVVKKSLDKDLMPVAVTFLYGKGDLKSEFNAELDRSGKYGDKDDLVLRLTPKRPSAQYKNLFLVVSPKDFHVTQSVIVDSSNNVNHFRFYQPNFEKPIKDSYFEFDPNSVRNYRVIDGDAGGKDGIAGAGMTPPSATPPRAPVTPPAPGAAKPAPPPKQ